MIHVVKDKDEGKGLGSVILQVRLTLRINYQNENFTETKLG